MPSPRREYKFTESGIPTLAEQWRGEIPEILDFAPTASGRRARGQLENILDHVCKSWMMQSEVRAQADQCTAEWLATAVTAIDGRATSTGACRRVLLRWRDLGYAIVEENPLRFVGLTEQGMKIGIDELERRSKKKSRHFDWDAPRKVPRERE